jgi:hypothetical protein
VSRYDPGYYNPYEDPSPAAAEDYIEQRVNAEFERREAIDGINSIFMEEVGKFPERARELLFDTAWRRVREAAEQGMEMDEAQLRALVTDGAALIDSLAPPSPSQGSNPDLSDLSDLPNSIRYEIEQGQRTGRRNYIAESAAAWYRDNRQQGQR